MFIAMNRFKVKSGNEVEFEEVWKTRDSFLVKYPGFWVFIFLKGTSSEEHTLYSSHSTWDDQTSLKTGHGQNPFVKLIQVHRAEKSFI